MVMMIKTIKTRARIRTYIDSIITNFYNKTGFKELLEEKIPHECFSIIILDSVIYAYEKYYPQTFLEECKYEKTKNYIDMELKWESDSDSDSDNNNSNKNNNNNNNNKYDDDDNNNNNNDNK